MFKYIIVLSLLIGQNAYSADIKTKSYQSIDQSNINKKYKPQTSNKKNLDVPKAMLKARESDAALKNSYNQMINSSKQDKDESDKNGMKIALKDLAKQFENRIMSMMWHKMFKKDDVGIGEKIWSSERTRAFVEAGEQELGEIGLAVYEQLITEMNIKNASEKNISRTN